MSKKLLIIVGAAVLLLLAGGAAYYIYGGGSDDSDVSTAGGSLPPDKVQPDDKVMGSSRAPVTMVEYFAQDCSVCAGFNQDVFPLLKAKYIDTGKVLYIMRLLPISPLDGPSYRLDLCVPPKYFFNSVDLLFRNQPQWDSYEYPVADAHAGLMRMARILGLTDAQAEACMSSTKYDAAINKVAQDATARYQPDGTPTLVIDFHKADLPDKSWTSVQAAIDAALVAKGVK